VLNQPLEERTDGYEETVDAFGIPFVGFPVQKRKRSRTGSWGNKPVWIEPDSKKVKFRIRVPNVRSWAVSVVTRLSEVIQVGSLPITHANPVAEVVVRSVVGTSEKRIKLDDYRTEWPLLKTAFVMARELLEVTSPGSAMDQGFGPTFDELLELTLQYVDSGVSYPPKGGDQRDIAIPHWRLQAVDILENAVRGHSPGTAPVPILATPEWLDSTGLRRFQWTGIVADGKKAHTGKVPCHTNLEKQFADFLDSAPDVVRYLKNERFGFSVTYYENSRPRQFYPDFIVAVRGNDGKEVMWLAETKGEMRTNVTLKNAAAEFWCQKMSLTKYGQWQYLFAQQLKLEAALATGIQGFGHLVGALR
jgi:type III restriction enzyme